MVAVGQPILRHFTASDLDVLINRDGQEVPHTSVLAQAKSGPSFTAMVDGRPIGCAGMVFPWPGVGSTWMIVSEELGEHGLWMYRTVRKFLEDMVRMHSLHRMEAVALVNSPRNQAFLEGLRFHVEQQGVARGFLADGRSVVRYEWVKE